MTLPASGPISFNNINVELGQPGTTNANINQAPYRTLAGIPGSGTTISLSNFYGKSNRSAIALTGSGTNYDVYTNRGPTYVAGKSDITVTVPTSVGSTSTGTYALLVPSAFTSGDTITIVNNGVIQGMGGAGGNGGNSPSPAAGSPGAVGGNAIYINFPTTITNNGTIASGGGGGGGGNGWATVFTPKSLPSTFTGGGGGGGGAGINGGAGGTGGTASGSPGGGPLVNAPGNPGSPGTSPAGGAGGAAKGPYPPQIQSTSAGGAGGGRGAAGSAGVSSIPGPSGTVGSGGATGYYLVGNPFVTWPATGTRQGNVV